MLDRATPPEPHKRRNRQKFIGVVEREASPEVREFFRRLGVENLPRISFLSRQKIEEICGSGALGCVKNGRVYVQEDLHPLRRKGIEAHELAHELFDMREIGAHLTEYYFLRARRLPDKILV